MYLKFFSIKIHTTTIIMWMVVTTIVKIEIFSTTIVSVFAITTTTTIAI